MNQSILIRLSVLEGMRDAMTEEATKGLAVDCSSERFKLLDSAVRSMDTLHISRLRVSLDVGEEIPLGQWMDAMETGGPMLTHAQATALLRNAMNKAQLSFDSIIAPVVVEELEDAC